MLFVEMQRLLTLAGEIQIRCQLYGLDLLFVELDAGSLARVLNGGITAESGLVYPGARPSSGFFLKKKPPSANSEWALLLGFRSSGAGSRCFQRFQRSISSQFTAVF